MFSWLLFLIGAVLYYYTVGFDFSNALVFLGNNSPVNPPQLNSIIAYVYHNPAISVVIDVGLTAADLVVITTSLLVVTRWIFAWAFDRIAPSKLATVHEKYNTPYIIAIIAWVGGEILLLIVLYTGIVSAILNAALGLMIFFVPGLISGMIFPYRRKELYNASPDFTKKKLGGIPVITICGAISAFGLMGLLVLIMAVPQAGYPLTPISGAFMIGYWFVGLVLYFIIQSYRKKQEIDLKLIFRQVPPE